MSKPKRFRDMNLTESDVETLIHADRERCERKLRWDVDPGGVGEEIDNSELEVFVERAQRLLPLWRQWGLRDLAAKSKAVEVVQELDGRSERLLEQGRWRHETEYTDGQAHAYDQAAELVKEAFGLKEGET